jgi:putative hemolysin
MKPLTAFCVLALLMILAFGCGSPNNNASQNQSANISKNTSKLYPDVMGFDVSYCEGIGYTYEYRPDAGKEKYTGYCVFPNGSECPADEFGSGLCHREFSLCEIKGYVLRIGVEQSETYNMTYPICIFPDNSYCKETEFFYRKCPVKW